jgi:hypothetical protein
MKTCRACSRPFAKQAHFHTCPSCYFSLRPRVRRRDGFASLKPSPAAEINARPGQLSIFDVLAPERAAEPEVEDSAFIRWLDQQERVA